MDPGPVPHLNGWQPISRARTDLEYTDIHLGGEDVVLVRDPVRGAYFRYNVLQAAMLRALDGRRSLDEILDELSERFEVEIPRGVAERFVEHVRKELLLDISSYAIPGGRVGARVARALRRHGYSVSAGTGEDVPAPAPEGQSGTELLAEALRQLEAGRFTSAVARFTAVLERAPGDDRCRRVLRIIQEAFIRATSPRGTDYPTIPLLDPDRLLGFLSRTIGPFLFSWAGAASIAALLCWALSVYADLSFAEVTIGPLDIAVAIGLSFLADLIHELSHGLACKYYGGPVHEIGVLLQFHFQPIPYCDTSSSYLFSRKHQKLLVQMAGTIGSLMLSSVMVFLLAVIPSSVAFYPGLLVAFGINTGYAVALNIIPFVKYDGYYALADYLDIPNLRERSFQYARAFLAHRLIGAAPPPEVSARERRVFLRYAPMSATFTVLWVFFLYRLMIFQPLIDRFQGFGLVLGLMAACLLSWGLLLRPAWRAGVLVFRNARALLRPRVLGMGACAAVLLVGPFAVPWPTMVDASFVLVPRARAVVRAEASGVIREITVREGEWVEAGQVVARLYDDALARSLESTDAEIARATAQITVLERGARPEELAVARRRLEQASATRDWEQEQANRATALAAHGILSAAHVEASAADWTRARAEAVALEKEVALLEAGTRRELLAAARAARDVLRARRAELEATQARWVLRSPLSGVVVTARPEERQGMAAKPGDAVVEVHDLREVTAELALGPASTLGEVQPGDRVVLRVTGAPSRATVTRLERLATAAAVGPTGPTVVAHTAPFALEQGRAGMTGHARIYGQQRMLGYAQLYLPLRRLLDVELWSLW